MKKLLFLLFALLLIATPALKADDISLGKARAAAEMFFAQCGVDTRAGSSLTLLGTDLTLEQTRSSEAPAWYVFNRAEGGFVIISGLDAAMPVLGYSFEDSFGPLDEMPENLKDWMDTYTEEINGRRASGKEATAEELARWADALTMTRAAELPESIDLKTANWNQGAPYNRKCPYSTSKSKRTLTGCTATAISEVMYYYKHPAHGKGTISSYTANGFTIPAMKLDTIPFQWDKMRSSYKSGSYTDEEGDAVATLMYAVASMLGSSFGTSGTSAVLYASRLTKYMDYDSCVVRFSRSYHTAASWKSTLKSYIGAGHPFLFRGTSASGNGHAFVVDGYDAQDRFLINFGWGGSSNGYYQIDAFGSYRSSQVLYHVRPNEGGSTTPGLRLTYGTLNDVYYNGITHRGGKIATGSTFTIIFGIVNNYGYYSFSGLLNFAHTDKSGNIKCILRSSDISFSNLSSGDNIAWGTAQTMKTTEPIERGDKVVALYRKNASDSWHKFNYHNSRYLFPEMALHIRDYTTVDYDATKAVFTFKTYVGTTWQLLNSSDEPVASGTASDGTFTINRKNYPAGTYKLVLDHFSVQSLTATLVF